ncbi:MAG: hypothetical protein ACLVJ6_05070 [Merdibacter sp.]
MDGFGGKGVVIWQRPTGRKLDRRCADQAVSTSAVVDCRSSRGEASCACMLDVCSPAIGCRDRPCQCRCQRCGTGQHHNERLAGGRDRRKSVVQKDLEEAIETVVAGYQKARSSQPER